MGNEPFDYGPKLPSGQHSNHPTLPGDLQPTQEIRQAYKHTTCNAITTMHISIARTYAVDPSYYGSTFCCTCKDYLPTSEFVWPEDGKPINKPLKDSPEPMGGPYQ